MNRRPLIVVLGGALVLAILIGVFFLLRARRAEEAAPTAAVPGAGARAPSDLKASCERLADRALRDSCLLNAAAILDDASLCLELSLETEQKNCQDSRSLSRALKQRDPSLCAAFAEPVKQSCEEQIYSLLGSALECDSLAENFRTVCRDLQQALRAGSPADCQTIADEAKRLDCLGRFAVRPDTDQDGLADELEEALYRTSPTKKDSDGDGLTDGEEVSVYDSDPNKADTDGDGFSDGTEVRNGYNPLGPGRLKP